MHTTQGTNSSINWLHVSLLSFSFKKSKSSLLDLWVLTSVSHTRVEGQGSGMMTVFPSGQSGVAPGHQQDSEQSSSTTPGGGIRKSDTKKPLLVNITGLVTQ